jgi:alanine racemase
MICQNTYATINLQNLISNCNYVKQTVGDKKILAIVKADAYGHGAVACANALEANGVDYFAVASLDEARELRDAGIRSQILILGYLPEKRLAESIPYDVTYAVYSREFAMELNRVAKEAGTVRNIHIKLNTGMNRLGFRPTEHLIDTLAEIASLKSLSMEGIFSHYATADEADLTYTAAQNQIFCDVVTSLKKRNINPPLIHIGNSAGILTYPCDITTAVRPGIILYGINPSEYVEETKQPPLKPVMNFYSKIANIAELREGETVSYGRKFHANAPRKIAVVCAGYADGYFRGLSGKAEVLVRGQRAPIIGNICMDMFMIDISDLKNVEIDDEVTLFGEDLPVTELADILGTIPYELTCSVSKRVRRIYI